MANVQKNGNRTNTIRRNSGTGGNSRTVGTKRGSASSGNTRTATAPRAHRETAAEKRQRLEEEERYLEALRESEERRNSIKDEILAIIVLLFCVLLVLSYLGLCSKLGDVLNGIVFGLLGSFGYVFPFAFFLLSLFVIANRNHSSVALRLVFAFLMMVFISALIQTVVGGYTEELKLKDYFNNSMPDYIGLNPAYGGLLGGFICMILLPNVGKVASIIIIVAAIIIFFILMAGKAIFSSMAQKGVDKIRDAEERSRQREREKEEEELISDRNFLEEQAYLRQQQLNAQNKYPEDEKLRQGGLRDEMRSRRRKDMRPLSEKYEEEFPNNPDELLKKLEETNEKARKGSFIDSLMRKGMGMDREIVTQTPEYRELLEKYGAAAEKKNERSVAEKTGNRAVEGVSEKVSEKVNDELSELTDPENIDIVDSELSRKFAGKSGNFSINTMGNARKKPENRVYMVDEDPDAEKDGLNGGEEVRNPSNITVLDTSSDRYEDVKTSAEECKVIPFNRKDSAENDPERTSLGAAGFTDPKAAALNLAKEKPEPPYEFPPIAFLKKSEDKAKSSVSSSELESTVEKLQRTFESFGVRVNVTNATCGPTVTRYELMPEQGVKVKTITSLSDDIKLALAAPEIRIEAPIPGKAAVGIEVPNSKTSPVFFGDLIDSPEFKDAHSNLTFAVGKDIGGKTICTDIAGMPHLLIAGATGSGKSVCINALIMSIIYKAKPSDVKLLMIDPKRVELVGYNGIPHLLVPVVTDVKKASGVLNWAIAEMDDRYERFADAGVNNLASYNRLMEEKYFEEGNEGECPDRLPQILIIVDELNDLMMTANSKEVEASICRLTQLARASGIHVVLATQRPSVNVITGTIKANIPSRIAFSVSSIVDSRTIIDQAGAEKLLGKGDMLFYPQGYPKPVRLQGAYVSDKEVAKVVEFLKEKSKEFKYNELVSKKIEEGSKTVGSVKDQQAQTKETPDNDRDEFFADAGRFIIEKNKSSIGTLQRVFRIGFNRAARIMDQLADEGVVGPEDGTKARKILMTLPQFEAYLKGETGPDEEDDTDVLPDSEQEYENSPLSHENEGFDDDYGPGEGT